jgi:putative nucleotidyltransferase with HDIG domain
MNETLLKTSKLLTLTGDADEQNRRKIKLIVSHVNNLPTPPAVFQQINNVINDPDTSAYEIANIISEDPALTAKVLRLTNSAFYGIPRTVTNVKQAIVILGLEVVKSLVISASVFEMFSQKEKLDADYLDYFWRHSLAAAIVGRIISREKSIPSMLEAEVAFAAGLLHDIGKLIIVSELKNAHHEIKAALSRDTVLSEYGAETEILGFSHADIGASLCVKWNLPEQLCRAVAFHHDETLASSDTWIALMHLANYLAHQLDITNNRFYPNQSPFYDAAWNALALSPGQQNSLVDSLKNEYARAEVFIKLARGL